MSPTSLRHALAAAVAAGVIALAGCGTDDAVKRDAKDAGRTIDREAGNADEKAGEAGKEAGREAEKAAEDVDGN